LILGRELDGRLGFGELIEQHLPHSPGRQGRGKVSEARVEGGPVSGFGILRRGKTGLFHGWCQHLALQTRLTFGCCPNFRCSAGFQPALSRQDGGATFKLVGHVALRHPQSMKIRTRSGYDHLHLRGTKADCPWSGEPAN
jgi:hypothetical protein